MSGAGPLADLRAAARADGGAYGPASRLRRALRMARMLAWRDAHARLAASPALRAHVAAVAPGDWIFWLSHRAYLARDLPARERVELALSHYEEEGRRFDQAYHDAVYAGSGLTVWRSEAKGSAFEVRLMPGNDVLYEGGLSLVLFADGERVCVLSFSWAPERVVLGRGDGRLPFVTRKQLTGDHAYQAAFHAAFDRVTPAHLCVGALWGLAQALGHARFAAIAADRHPAWAKPELRELLVAAYDDYWTSLGGERVSSLSFVVELPPQLSSVEHMDAKRRRRAMARRGHMDAVRQAAQDTVAAHLRPV